MGSGLAIKHYIQPKSYISFRVYCISFWILFQQVCISHPHPDLLPSREKRNKEIGGGNVEN